MNTKTKLQRMAALLEAQEPERPFRFWFEVAGQVFESMGAGALHVPAEEVEAARQRGMLFFTFKVNGGSDDAR